MCVCVCVRLSGSEGLQVHAPCRGNLRAAIFKRVAQILPEYLWRDFVTCWEMLLPTYLWGILLPKYLWGDFATEEPVRGGDAVYQSTCGGNLSVETLLPKYLWGDFVTKEPVVGFCYQSTCGGILLPKYLWWDFVTKVPVGGFVTKIPVGGSGNLELLLRQTVSWVDLWGRCMGQCCPAALAERNRLTSLVGRNRLSAMGHKNLNRKKRSWLFRFSGRNPLTRATA